MPRKQVSASKDRGRLQDIKENFRNEKELQTVSFRIVNVSIKDTVCSFYIVDENEIQLLLADPDERIPGSIRFQTANRHRMAWAILLCLQAFPVCR